MHLKTPTDPVPLVLGKAFHRALELLETKKIHPVTTFTKEFQRKNIRGISPSKFQMERDEAIRLLDYWYKNKRGLLALSGFAIKESEVPFDLKVEKDPLTKNRLKLPPIHGIVDFVTDNGKIGDYKTSSKKYSQEMVDTSDQPTFYYLWHLLERGQLPKEFVYIVFRKGIKKEPIQILSTHRTIEQVSELLSDIVKFVKKVNNKEYSQRHDDSERFCDCYLYEQMLSVQLWRNKKSIFN